MTSPITVEQLRADWDDDPTLDDDELATLASLSDETLQSALDEAFRAYQDVYFHVLDNTRAAATSALLYEGGSVSYPVISG